MGESEQRVVCWAPTWDKAREGVGLERLVLRAGEAESTVLAFDEAGRSFRLAYRLTWDDRWYVRTAYLEVEAEGGPRSLALAADGEGRWSDGAGQPLPDLEGCLDIDIWPTPFTNTFPIRREPMAVGEEREFRMAWVSAPELTVRPMRQAYRRLGDREYLYRSFEGRGFQARLTVDANDMVVDYEGVFRRVG